jgi:hypothetical protein
MNKNEWEKVYSMIEKFHSDFREAYPDYKNGRNKKIRDAAKGNVYSAIDLARLRVEGNPEILGLLLESRFGQQYAYGEFWEARYFGDDMREFLLIMRQKIDSIE